MRRIQKISLVSLSLAAALMTAPAAHAQLFQNPLKAGIDSARSAAQQNKEALSNADSIAKQNLQNRLQSEQSRLTDSNSVARDRLQSQADQLRARADQQRLQADEAKSRWNNAGQNAKDSLRNEKAQLKSDWKDATTLPSVR